MCVMPEPGPFMSGSLDTHLQRPGLAQTDRRRIDAGIRRIVLIAIRSPDELLRNPGFRYAASRMSQGAHPGYELTELRGFR